jgi:hypothetical protein
MRLWGWGYEGVWFIKDFQVEKRPITLWILGQAFMPSQEGGNLFFGNP